MHPLNRSLAVFALALAPTLPVVLMSGFPESDFAQRNSGLELAGYLQKPFRLPALVQLLGRVLSD